ncbi:MoxR family ATPase [Candidatus Woesearchaeota archaeon]|jgi:MoxR-like ATPase|nr:MoxR family ATPase [Candidatus Woesearchaeota archaeon]MBT3438461.1 MoxR family ATPase [Candidatus Woesearchaeota archaeon]MBT4058354.1 MoxR family ATPase [Candidatus Woesearchaeota archaeon]MBT4208793.1 MoxR family ATPase [Candidatus Woesearchaeota archaeon]MBT4731684.1 MoxR family ATPase [Candidatus Woesearchaeota archaeon]
MISNLKSSEDVKSIIDEVLSHIGYIVVGQEEVIKQTIISILCGANALLEGYPGLAKTLTVNSLSKLMDLKFSRIQGTPDLMPSDIIGTHILEEKNGKREFSFQQGPLFSNIVLMDEINRATPKTQSALLEAMQEKQVTVGTQVFKMDKPFFVLATQNPVEQEGTYPLPEAQCDRFLFKIRSQYPKFDEEVEIVNRFTEEEREIDSLKPVLGKENIINLQKMVRQVPVANDIKHYAVDLVNKTRNHKELIEFGASPRASLGLLMASKAKALIEGRNYVNKEDINEMALPVLRHRIILNFEAERNNFDADAVIKYLLK